MKKQISQGESQNQKNTKKEKRQSTKSLLAKIDSLTDELMAIKGKGISEKINMGIFQRKASSEIAVLKKRCSELSELNRNLGFAFGEFKCRELLFLASQWVRNANFDIKVNGNVVSRKSLVPQIDSFLKGWTFK